MSEKISLDSSEFESEKQNLVFMPSGIIEHAFFRTLCIRSEYGER